jgi:16S rRNA (guanine527-N7)-methyltransferase
VTISLEHLRETLEQARTAGFLGPGPVEPHIHHAQGFAAAVEAALGREPENFADLGTGGGVPGLVLGVQWPRARGVLVESGQRRCAWLREAVLQLDLEDRIDVLEERAEKIGHPGDWRERFDAVTARSFAGPAVTAEIAAGLVKVGGVLVVSEPPTPEPRRWPADELRNLGFDAADPVEFAQAHFAAVRKRHPAPEKFPRRVGQPSKHPLW